MKKAIIAGLFMVIFANPIAVSAAALTEPQIQAIIGLLQAFSADSSAISRAEAAMRGTSTTVAAESLKDPVTFKLKDSAVGLFDIENKLLLAKYEITANDKKLRGKSFGATVSFAPNVASTTKVTYNCASIDVGETATCEIRAEFSETGDFVYTIKRTKIENLDGKPYYDTDVLEAKIKAR